MQPVKDKRIRPYPHFKFPDEVEIGYKLLSGKECEWFGVPYGSYDLTCLNYGWFPTGEIMGVIKGNYSDTHKIGATISGNMGTRSIAVVNIDKATQLLNEAGYKKIVRLTDEV
jgi:hypothetical protein